MNEIPKKRKNTFLDRFTVYELIIISLTAALGLASKPVIVPITHIITGPLFIPGGSVAGGFYMMWIVLGASLVRKRGAASLIALTQGIIVMITGSFGTHGVISILTYGIPGITLDLIFILLNKRYNQPIDFFLAGVIANLSGTYLSNLVFFRLPLIPLALSLSTGALSGGLGGLLAYMIFKKVKIIVD
ncbi:MAG: ECF transporter S component [Tissierellales bacterium]|jgi:ABC-type thiamin/hydroxymethylpyrimidine transport system permease subunit|nr:ECF transporter S component [Tissierellales bacterium]MBN2828254.1 ECF transporter S component [Tissierellales bacterium]